MWGIIAEEAKHFVWVEERLKEIKGLNYGSLPAHLSLLFKAKATQECLLKRVCTLCLIEEGRALDSSHSLYNRFISFNDKKSADIILQICKEEERHVSIGVDWFNHFCSLQRISPEEFYFQQCAENKSKRSEIVTSMITKKKNITN